jgi:hypothetical protein
MILRAYRHGERPDNVPLAGKNMLPNYPMLAGLPPWVYCQGRIAVAPAPAVVVVVVALDLRWLV